MVIVWMSLTVLAGYGDPLDGHPRYDDRAIHLWTDAARIAPTAWEDDYGMKSPPCSAADFRSAERRPRPGLRWNHDLGEAARAHTDDMVENGFFSHTSSNGTQWSSRVRSFYPDGAIGENIARGYRSSRSAVLLGWMCSDGHRANITADTYDEIGASARSQTYTQNFGGRGLRPREVSSGLHHPEHPTSEVQILANLWIEVDELEEVVAVIEGVEVPMRVIAGTEGRGLYSAWLATTAACHRWFVEVRSSSGSAVRYPEEGSYGWGDCGWDDPETRWSGEQIEPVSSSPSADPYDDLDGPLDCEGCASGSGPLSWSFLGALVFVLRRRTLPCPLRPG
ncbi:MAG: CAP domain-containing protein [Deltaproteobacteria bacterium]|nr:MAG: CAP domain-containing protein [Deltaproteobacteria bacterium]